VEVLSWEMLPRWRVWVEALLVLVVVGEVLMVVLSEHKLVFREQVQREKKEAFEEDLAQERSLLRGTEETQAQLPSVTIQKEEGASSALEEETNFLEIERVELQNVMEGTWVRTAYFLKNDATSFVIPFLTTFTWKTRFKEMVRATAKSVSGLNCECLCELGSSRKTRNSGAFCNLNVAGANECVAVDSWESISFHLSKGPSVTVDIVQPVSNVPENVVCVQGPYYPEKLMGRIPAEMLHYFLEHYAAQGFEQVALYAYEEEELVEVFSTLDQGMYPLKSLKLSLRIMEPDASFKSNRNRVPLTGSVIQEFPIVDCIYRARAFGSKRALLVDLDEFVFPTKGDDSLVTAVKRNQGSHRNIVLLNSYLVNTLYCSEIEHVPSKEKPLHYRDYLQRSKVMKLDVESYNGRQKYLVEIWTISDDITRASFHIHEAIGLKNEPFFNRAAILHMRESWHENVCSRRAPNHSFEDWEISPLAITHFVKRPSPLDTDSFEREVVEKRPQVLFQPVPNHI